MVVIGICGRSCSGKSTIAGRFKEEHQEKTELINQDMFFKIRADSWETTDAIRFDMMIEAINLLRSGKSCMVPSKKNSEMADSEIRPNEIILVEGYLLYVNLELNNLIDKRIWISVSDTNILERRIRRDGSDRNKDYIVNEVIPISKRYCKEQKEKADAIFDGNVPDSSYGEVKNYIESII